jgi:hypothetical protein
VDAAWDTSKRRTYRQVSSPLPFVPMLVKSYGPHEGPALTLLRDLADQTVQAGKPGLSQATFTSRRSGSSALPFTEATRPCVGRAHTLRRGLAGPQSAVLPGPRRRCLRPFLRPKCGFLVQLCLALRSLALWRVCAIAPSFVSGWRAFSSASLCTSL